MKSKNPKDKDLQQQKPGQQMQKPDFDKGKKKQSDESGRQGSKTEREDEDADKE